MQLYSTLKKKQLSSPYEVFFFIQLWDYTVRPYTVSMHKKKLVSLFTNVLPPPLKKVTLTRKKLQNTLSNETPNQQKKFTLTSKNLIKKVKNNNKKKKITTNRKKNQQPQISTKYSRLSKDSRPGYSDGVDIESAGFQEDKQDGVAQDKGQTPTTYTQANGERVNTIRAAMTNTTRHTREGQADQHMRKQGFEIQQQIPRPP